MRAIINYLYKSEGYAGINAVKANVTCCELIVDLINTTYCEDVN